MKKKKEPKKKIRVMKDEKIIIILNSRGFRPFCKENNLPYHYLKRFQFPRIYKNYKFELFFE